MKKNLFLLFVCLLSLLSIVSCDIFHKSTRPDVYADAWQGSGIASDPYTISNQLGLEALADSVKLGKSYTGRYFVLTADINM